MGRFYRNLLDNGDSSLGSDFRGRIVNDADVYTDDVQKYLFATSDFSKGMEDEINHYITRDRISNASFRQKLDPIAKKRKSFRTCFSRHFNF